MRAILIVLLLVNVAWAVWGGALRSPGTGPGATGSGGTGKSLALLSELPPEALATAQSAASDEAAKPVAEVAPAEPDLSAAIASIGSTASSVSTDKPQKCLLMGPFDEIDRVETLRDEVLGAGGNAEIVADEVDGRPDYLVYIFTNGSRVVARCIRQELDGQDIDSHIIAGGELENALSVGVFSREPLARAQYDRVIALDYEAAVRELPRRQTVYHLMSDRPVADPEVPGRAACHEIAAAQPF